MTVTMRCAGAGPRQDSDKLACDGPRRNFGSVCADRVQRPGLQDTCHLEDAVRVLPTDPHAIMMCMVFPHECGASLSLMSPAVRAFMFRPSPS
eukprot:2874510-Rhodomonas_salina.1